MQDQRALIADILRSQMSEQPQMMQAAEEGSMEQKQRQFRCQKLKAEADAMGEPFDMVACMLEPLRA